MKFEFDPQKNEINKGKHGLSFEDAMKLWQVAAVEFDLQPTNGEFRYMRIGRIPMGIVIAVFSFRHGPVVRLISARLATENEIALYEKNRKK